MNMITQYDFDHFESKTVLDIAARKVLKEYGFPTNENHTFLEIWKSHRDVESSLPDLFAWMEGASEAYNRL